MTVKLKTIDRDTPMLFPPDLRDWIPANHIVHFVIDAVNHLSTDAFLFNHRGTGDAQYSARMMLTLLIYCYSTGRFSSRIIEEATWSDVIVRYICGGDLHPDHDTICTFRRKNKKLFEQAFVDVLRMASTMGSLKKVGTVSVDGTKIKANASKHSAVSYKHAGEQLELLSQEVEELMQKAENADSTPLEDGLSIPDEIVRRQDRITQLKEARRIIEERDTTQKKAEYEGKMEKREEQKKEGKPLRGTEPVRPENTTPDDKKQYNFTDPESRIMKAGNGKHFEQAYNAQVAVDAESYLIVAQYVTDAPNDKEQLNPVIDSIPCDVVTPEHVLADTGYFSEKAVLKAESNTQTIVYCAIEKTGHHRSVADLEKQVIPESPAPDASVKERMKYRLKTQEGRALYNLRKQTVEPVFGIIKSVLGFRQFSMRGLQKVNTEWSLVCLSYNIKKLFKLQNICAQVS